LVPGGNGHPILVLCTEQEEQWYSGKNSEALQQQWQQAEDSYIYYPTTIATGKEVCKSYPIIHI